MLIVFFFYHSSPALTVLEAVEEAEESQKKRCPLNPINHKKPKKKIIFSADTFASKTFKQMCLTTVGLL